MVNSKQIIATCKHYAVYDLETGRYGNDYDPSQQDLADYFLAPFKACVRDAHVGSIMVCIGRSSIQYDPDADHRASAHTMPSRVLLRVRASISSRTCSAWNFTAEYNYVTSDCGAVTDIWQYHNFTDTEEAAASVALK